MENTPAKVFTRTLCENTKSSPVSVYNVINPFLIYFAKGGNFRPNPVSQRHGSFLKL